MSSNAVNEGFMLSKVFGCFPFCLKDGEFIVDYKLLAYSIILKLIFAPQPIINIFHHPPFAMFSLINLITVTVSCILVNIFSYISFFNYFVNRKNLVKIIKRHQVADAVIRSLGGEPYNSVTLYSDCLLLAVAPCLSCIRYNRLNQKRTWHVAYRFAYLINLNATVYMLVHPFIWLVDNLTVRMKRLRLTVRRLSESAPSRTKTYHLGSAIYLYDLLCSTSDDLNGIFSYNILFFIFMVFFMITTFAYISIKSAFESYISAFIAGVTPIFYGTILCRIAIHCERMTKEAAEFNNLLFQMMIKDRYGDIQNNKKLRLHILMKRKVEFNVCGLFLDHAFLHSMVAAVTTYYVILEEFGK